MQNRKLSDQAELLRFALSGINAQIADLERKRAELLERVSQSNHTTPPFASSAAVVSAVRPRKRRKLSASHRAKLRAAAKKRWAKAKAG